MEVKLKSNSLFSDCNLAKTKSRLRSKSWNLKITIFVLKKMDPDAKEIPIVGISLLDRSIRSDVPETKLCTIQSMNCIVVGEGWAS